MKVRSFVAIDLPNSVKAVLKEVSQQLGDQVPHKSVRWSRVEGIHLTLKFLGDVDEEKLPEIKAALAQVAGQHAPFTFTFGEVGCFPNTRRPRVIWVGVQEKRGVLQALQRDVENSLKPLGFEPEKRAFHPHLTLGRTHRRVRSTDQRRLGEVIANARVGELGRVDVDALRLMRSQLHPSGSIYTPLAVLALGQ